MPGLLTLSQSTLTKLGKANSLACMFEYDKDDNITGYGIGFQYFPESISDTKAVNYQTKDIPGGSLPLYQWTSSGERIISFTAYFTSDIDLCAGGPQTQAAYGANDPNPMFANLSSQGLASRNIDVRTALYALRRFLFPIYQKQGTQPGQPLTQSPPKVMLVFTGSGLGLLGGFGQMPDSPSASAASPSSVKFNAVDMDAITCVMTQCDVTIEALFPSGAIRIASVQLSFAQIAQLGGQVTFPSFGPQDIQRSTYATGVTSLLAPYPIQVSWTTGTGVTGATR